MEVLVIIAFISALVMTSFSLKALMKYRPLFSRRAYSVRVLSTMIALVAFLLMTWNAIDTERTHEKWKPHARIWLIHANRVPENITSWIATQSGYQQSIALVGSAGMEGYLPSTHNGRHVAQVMRSLSITVKDTPIDATLQDIRERYHSESEIILVIDQDFKSKELPNNKNLVIMPLSSRAQSQTIDRNVSILQPADIANLGPFKGQESSSFAARLMIAYALFVLSQCLLCIPRKRS